METGIRYQFIKSGRSSNIKIQVKNINVGDFEYIYNASKLEKKSILKSLVNYRKDILIDRLTGNRFDIFLDETSTRLNYSLFSQTYSFDVINLNGIKKKLTWSQEINPKPTAKPDLNKKIDLNKIEIKDLGYATKGWELKDEINALIGTMKLIDKIANFRIHNLTLLSEFNFSVIMATAVAVHSSGSVQINISC